MDLQPLTTPPKESDFQPLCEYQSTTPTSFFSGPPVLHHHSPTCTLTLTHADLASDPALSALSPQSTNGTAPTPASTNGTTSASLTIRVSAWATSTSFQLFCPAAGAGVAIPYRAISLHAAQGAAVWLQLCLDDVRRVADEELRTVEMVLTPGDAAEGQAGDVVEVQALFAALSECADLNPDPAEEEEGGLGVGEGEGDLEGGGWITAENVGEYLADEEGEGEERLGPGAGSRRGAEEEEGDGDGDGEETKWRRTE